MVVLDALCAREVTVASLPSSASPHAASVKTAVTVKAMIVFTMCRCEPLCRAVAINPAFLITPADPQLAIRITPADPRQNYGFLSQSQ